jgi:hypothetical protein
MDCVPVVPTNPWGVLPREMGVLLSGGEGLGGEKGPLRSNEVVHQRTASRADTEQLTNHIWWQRGRICEWWSRI